jgi:hypothetical protein
MRLFFIPLLSATILFIKGCDLNDATGKRPEQIQHIAEQQLSPYFPRAKVIVSEEQRAILGITCVSNVGKPFLEQMVPVLEKSEGVKQLRDYRANYAGLESLSRILGMKLVTYRYFSLGFDQYVIRLDADTQQHTVIPVEQLPHYAEQYAQQCGTVAPAAASPSASDQKITTAPHNTDNPDALYIWIGTFTVVTHKDGEAADEQSTIRAALGIYTQQDFGSSRAWEISQREQMIRQMLEQKHLEMKSLGLRQVERIAMPQSLEAVDMTHAGS